MTDCVYNTDPDWVRVIARHGIVENANFWRKDPRRLKLPKGSKFYFKLRGDRKIAGRGSFREQVTLALPQAWQRFGYGNGAESLPEFQERAAEVLKLGSTAEINCIILDNIELLSEINRPEISLVQFPHSILGPKYFEDDKLDFDRFFLQPMSADTTIAEDIQALLDDKDLSSTQRLALMKARLGQGEFREKVLAAWAGRCAVTGCSVQQAIRASHIKPWRVSSNAERLDPKNGLPLVANLDALFDAYLISFDKGGAMMVSASIPEQEKAILGVLGRLRVRPDKEMEFYLSGHRDHFEKNAQPASVPCRAPATPTANSVAQGLSA